MNNKNSKMLGIILVPLVFGILILVASAFTKVMKTVAMSKPMIFHRHFKISLRQES